MFVVFLCLLCFHCKSTDKILWGLFVVVSLLRTLDYLLSTSPFRLSQWNARKLSSVSLVDGLQLKTQPIASIQPQNMSSSQSWRFQLKLLFSSWLLGAHNLQKTPLLLNDHLEWTPVPCIVSFLVFQQVFSLLTISFVRNCENKDRKSVSNVWQKLSIDDCVVGPGDQQDAEKIVGRHSSIS